MLFSVIIPVYNRADLIRETIDSVLKQTFKDFEVIVVDDGSTDNTAAEVSKTGAPQVRYFYKENEERGAARNFGAEKAEGRYLIFLDSDDKLTPDHLQEIYQSLIQNDYRPKLLFSGYSVLHPDGSVAYEYSMKGLFKSNMLLYGNYLGCSPVTVDAQTFRKYYFNPDRAMSLFEDWELWLRIISDHDLYCIPAKTVNMLNHDGRSVLSSSPDELIAKVRCFKGHALKSVPLLKRSFANRRKFLMGVYSYASLHIALLKRYKLTSLRLLALSIWLHPSIITKRRFLGIIKQLL